MRALLNDEHPANLGRTCRVVAAEHHALADLVQQSPKTVQLMEAGEITCGWLAPLDDDERRRFNLPDEVHAVVYWWDGDDHHPAYELRELSRSEAYTITSQCEHVLVAAVCRHYHENGGEDDGHPAYAIYKLARARQAQQLRDAENSKAEQRN